MQRIIIDTNILVSALIQKSYPYLIINYFSGNTKIDICISEDIFTEYTEVLGRAKFLKYPSFAANAASLLSNIKNTGIKFNPKTRLSIIDDISDNKFMELAMECGADFLTNR